MGRDIYDAIFLFGRTRPNPGYMRTKTKIDDVDELKERLLAKCGELDFNRLSKDVEPFLIHPGDSKKIFLFGDYIKNMERVF